MRRRARAGRCGSMASTKCSRSRAGSSAPFARRWEREGIGERRPQYQGAWKNSTKSTRSQAPAGANRRMPRPRCCTCRSTCAACRWWCWQCWPSLATLRWASRLLHSADDRLDVQLCTVAHRQRIAAPAHSRAPQRRGAADRHSGRHRRCRVLHTATMRTSWSRRCPTRPRSCATRCVARHGPGRHAAGHRAEGGGPAGAGCGRGRHHHTGGARGAAGHDREAPLRHPRSSLERHAGARRA